MGLFRKSEEGVISESDDVTTNDEHIEKINDLLKQATDHKSLDVQEEELKRRLNALRFHIRQAQQEYDRSVKGLLPAKWRLAAKKSELAKIKSEYVSVSANLQKRKDELDMINQKIYAAKMRFSEYDDAENYEDK